MDAIVLRSESLHRAAAIADEELGGGGRLVDWASNHQIETAKIAAKSTSEMMTLGNARFPPHKSAIYYHTSEAGIEYWVVVVSGTFP